MQGHGVVFRGITLPLPLASAPVEGVQDAPVLAATRNSHDHAALAMCISGANEQVLAMPLCWLVTIALPCGVQVW
jgi:hypothetical protein